MRWSMKSVCMFRACTACLLTTSLCVCVPSHLKPIKYWILPSAGRIGLRLGFGSWLRWLKLD